MKVHIIEPLNVDQSIIENYSNELERNGFSVKQWSDRVEDAPTLIERCHEADVLIFSNIPFPAEVINACRNLKMISVAFTGVDHIDVNACKEKGIIVSNAAGYSTQSVAELTLGLMFSLLRNMVTNETKTRELKGRDGYVGTELKGKTIGIIGAGSIGQTVGKICNDAFQCEVLYYNRSPKDVGCGELVSLHDLLKESDVVSLHVPLNAESKGIIGKEELKLMKKEAFLINTARGAVVDNQALAMALNEENIAGAAIDIFEMEPPLPKNHPLLNAKNAILMPHIAYATDEAFKFRAQIVFDNILKWHHGSPQNVQQ